MNGQTAYHHHKTGKEDLLTFLKRLGIE